MTGISDAFRRLSECKGKSVLLLDGGTGEELFLRGVPDVGTLLPSSFQRFFNAVFVSQIAYHYHHCDTHDSNLPAPTAASTSTPASHQ